MRVSSGNGDSGSEITHEIGGFGASSAIWGYRSVAAFGALVVENSLEETATYVDGRLIGELPVGVLVGVDPHAPEHSRGS